MEIITDTALLDELYFKFNGKYISLAGEELDTKADYFSEEFDFKKYEINIEEDGHDCGYIREYSLRMEGDDFYLYYYYDCGVNNDDYRFRQDICVSYTGSSMEELVKKIKEIGEG